MNLNIFSGFRPFTSILIKELRPCNLTIYVWTGRPGNKVFLQWSLAEETKIFEKLQDEEKQDVRDYHSTGNFSKSLIFFIWIYVKLLPTKVFLCFISSYIKKWKCVIDKIPSWVSVLNKWEQWRDILCD